MTDDTAILYCENHPDVETNLRCNNCDKLICARCAVLTPTGYRCRECVRGRQKVFETAQWYDYPLGVTIATILSFLGSLLISYLGFLSIFVAPIAGVVIAEIIRFVIRRRRSRNLTYAVGIAAAVGSLPLLLRQILFIILGAGVYGFSLNIVWLGIYTFFVTSTVLYRLGGIYIK